MSLFGLVSRTCYVARALWPQLTHHPCARPRTHSAAANQPADEDALPRFLALACHVAMEAAEAAPQDAVAAEAAAGDPDKRRHDRVWAVLRGPTTVGDEAARELARQMQNPALALALLHALTDDLDLPPASRGMMDAFLAKMLPLVDGGAGASGGPPPQTRSGLAWRQWRLKAGRWVSPVLPVGRVQVPAACRWRVMRC